ncbi:hypothetical protein PCC7424_5404 (plasmid) [Gloeothece citriformis PCC 7424]|uniref:TRADD-like N-terminal domain-containing protein n=1 Tax=Gloeothece citriformis (strain PCC 7424) TaxID=65393 RepID=B7KMG0_GLOC7|nr:DUF1822 family protein [Gloeothece citriformis]ACK73982.1 hypothetical protein PCC7424_5404 [Gloeothece citriformis PCC 7424]
MPRSLKVAEVHKDKLEYALLRKGYATQKLFAENIELSLATVNKFFNCKPIDKLNFTEICHHLELDWDVITVSNSPDISPAEIDRRPPRKTMAQGKRRIRINLEATIDEFNKEMLDEFIRFIQEKSVDASFKLTKIEEGSIIFEFEGSEEGCQRLSQLFRSGQLTEILGIKISNVNLETAKSPPLNLREWLQNNFSEAVKAGWQNLEDILVPDPRSLALRNLSIEKAKRFDFGNNISLVFLLSLQRKFTQNDNLKLNFDFYPANPTDDYLPKGLKITIESETGQTVFEHQIKENQPNLKIDLDAELNEMILLKISLKEVTFEEALVA